MSELIPMKKPKKFKTATIVYGIDVRNRDIIEVPKHLFRDFYFLGFRRADHRKKKKE